MKTQEIEMKYLLMLKFVCTIFLPKRNKKEKKTKKNLKKTKETIRVIFLIDKHNI